MREDPAPGRLGRRLHDWRSAAGLNLTAAGQQMGVHPTTYQRWEQGRRPYTKQCEVIAGVLGEPASAVLALAGPPHRRPGRPAPENASPLMRARLAACMNRVELGRLLHVGQATIYQWEAGHVRPPASLLPRLAGNLGLTTADLEAALVHHPPCRHDGERLPHLGSALRGRGLSRAGVCRLLGIAGSTAFEWETGRRRVPLWALQRLSAACDVERSVMIADARRQRTKPPARALAAMRRQTGMTQKEAAAVLGISSSSLGRYEAGQRPLPPPLARAMSRLYRTPLARVLPAANMAVPPILLAPRWTSDELPIVLTELRKVAGLSRSQVARYTGVSHSTVHRWETGESAPSRHALAALELHYRLGPRRLTSVPTVEGASALQATR